MILDVQKPKPYLPEEPQRLFHESDALYKGMIGAFGSGKSRTGCEEGLALSLEFPGNIGLIGRHQLTDLKMTTMRTFFSIIPRELLVEGRLDKSFNKTERVLTLTTDPPSLVFFGPMNDAERYKSLELGWYFIDECSEVDLSAWLILSGRLRHHGVRLSGMMASNPTSKNHWIYKYFIEEPPPGYKVFRSKTKDNLQNLPPGYYENLIKNYPPDFVKMFVDGEFGIMMAGDPQFPDFSLPKHVRKIEHTPGVSLLRGWDFGIRHPCMAFCEFDDNGRFKILGAIKRENEDLYVFAERVKMETQAKYPGVRIRDFCDVAGRQRREDGKSAIMILNEKRIFPEARYSHPAQRMQELRRLMRQSIRKVEAFGIDPSCTYGVDAFANASIDERGEPNKDGYYEHFLDAVGAIITNTCMIGEETGIEGMDQGSQIKEASWDTGNAYEGEASESFEGFGDIDSYV